ncbi:MAG: prepilin-type N-terminal cleavage/methylation domain-containing protein [Chthonomonas sp.]|nr:prepilin-type N-terminal cleavage/methylation domain-containing protein [Chthonomonas sp.]
MRLKRAFTLIELITVMAITTILLTIITIPVVQSFNLSRAAQSYALAQDRARGIINDVVKDITNGSSVRDNSGLRGSVAVQVPGLAANSVETILLENTKLDIFQPAAAPSVDGGGGLRNPNLLINPAGDAQDENNWKVDPTLRAPVGQPVIPVTQGFRLVRWFVSLNRPIEPPANNNQDYRNWVPAAYRNPYDRLLTPRVNGRDNLFVLRRAEVAYRVYRGGAWQFNSDLFVDADGDGEPDNIDGPYFMIPGVDDVTGAALAGAAAQAKNVRIMNWIKASRVVTDIDRFDSIAPVYNKQTRQITYDGNRPRISSLITFQPTRIANESPDGQLPLRLGEESTNLAQVGADVFRTQFGGWARNKVSVRPSPIVRGGTNPIANVNDRIRLENLRRADGGIGIFYINPVTGENLEVFDLTAYELAKNDPAATGMARYPFTYAQLQADARSNWTGSINALRDFIPFSYSRRQGKVTTSFALTEVGQGAAFTVPAAGGFTSPDDNRPEVVVGPAFTPATDPAAALPAVANRWTTNIASPSENIGQINTRFNILWNDWDAIFPGLGNKQELVKRFIDLRRMLNKDSEIGPLYNNQQTWGGRGRIVPGSEVVIGPDQNAGPNYGRPIRYTRVSGQSVGPNEYKINYVDQPEPDWTAIVGAVPPAAYQSANPISAILQARYRDGYLEFQSDPSKPIPPGNISVNYRFQMNETNDIVAVDYETQQLMGVNITMLTFASQTSPNPQQVTLRGSGTVRNFLR